MTKVQLKVRATAVANELVEQQGRTLLKEAQRKVVPEGWWRHLKREIRDALLAFREVA